MLLAEKQNKSITIVHVQTTYYHLSVYNEDNIHDIALYRVLKGQSLYLRCVCDNTGQYRDEIK